MAKLDTTLIENFENLTDEEKVAALLNLEVDDKSSEVERLKKVNDKLSSENADKKRQLRSLQSEEEAKKQLQEEEINAMKEELEIMRADKKTANNRSLFMGVNGFDSDTATLIAPAFRNVDDEDTKVVVDTIKKVMANLENKIKLDLVKGTTIPKTNSSDKTITKEEFSKLTTKEKIKFKEEHPQDYANFYNK